MDKAKCTCIADPCECDAILASLTGKAAPAGVIYESDWTPVRRGCAVKVSRQDAAHIRAAKGKVPQKELARKYGVSVPYISQIQNNHKRPPTEADLILEWLRGRFKTYHEFTKVDPERADYWRQNRMVVLNLIDGINAGEHLPSTTPAGAVG